MKDEKIKKLYDRIRKGESIKEIEGRRVQVYAYAYIYLHNKNTKEMIKALKIWTSLSLDEQKEVEALVMEVIDNV